MHPAVARSFTSRCYSNRCWRRSTSRPTATTSTARSGAADTAAPSCSVSDQPGGCWRLIVIPRRSRRRTRRLRQDARFELIRNDFAEIGHIAVDRGLGGKRRRNLPRPGRVIAAAGSRASRLQFSARRPARHAHGSRTRTERGGVARDRGRRGSLSRVLRRFGEERYAPRIARAIVAARDEAPSTRPGTPCRTRQRGGAAARRQQAPRNAHLPGDSGVFQRRAGTARARSAR